MTHLVPYGVKVYGCCPILTTHTASAPLKDQEGQGGIGMEGTNSPASNWTYRKRRTWSAAASPLVQEALLTHRAGCWALPTGIWAGDGICRESRGNSHWAAHGRSQCFVESWWRPGTDCGERCPPRESSDRASCCTQGKAGHIVPAISDGDQQLHSLWTPLPPAASAGRQERQDRMGWGHFPGHSMMKRQWPTRFFKKPDC